MEKKRDYSLDNVRFLLIFFVVFAHLIEVSAPFRGSWLLNRIIYSFHMPAFIFLFGYNVKYSSERIVYRWFIPYVVFQSIYLAFSGFVLNDIRDVQYVTPYWLLWYMMACVFYQLLLPIYEVKNKCRQAIALGCVFVIALLVGFEDAVGYWLSLARFFTFQPWFLLGYYCKKNGLFESIAQRKKTSLAIVFMAIVIIFLSVPFLKNEKVTNELLYGAFSYSQCNGALWMRAVLFLISLGWISFLFVGVKPCLDKKIMLLTKIGQNTWPIFLMHGFIVKAIPIYCPSLLSSPLLVFLVAGGILVLIGNKVFNKVMYYISFSWLEKIANQTD